VSELLTPLDVVNQTFRKGFRGYDAGEVDEFLDQVAESLQTYVQRLKDAERALQLSEEQLKEFRELKESMQEALILAQKSADERIRSSQSQAEAIVAEARLKAQKIDKEAQERSDEAKRDLMRLRQVRNQYVAEFRGLLSKFDAMLSNTFPSGAEEGLPPVTRFAPPGEPPAPSPLSSSEVPESSPMPLAEPEERPGRAEEAFEPDEEEAPSGRSGEEPAARVARPPYPAAPRSEPRPSEPPRPAEDSPSESLPRRVPRRSDALGE